MVELENPSAHFLQAFMRLAIDDYCALINLGIVPEVKSLPASEEPPFPLTTEEMWATALMFQDSRGIVSLLRIVDKELSEEEFFERLMYACKREAGWPRLAVE